VKRPQRRLAERGLKLGFRVLGVLSWPLRVYWARSSRPIGRTFVLEKVTPRLLPRPPAGFETRRPGGGTVFVHYGEEAGLVSLLLGGYEKSESEALCALALPGSVAVDVGANIGMYTIPLASAVGPRGTVLAFEPFSVNVARLRENVDRNGLTNVEMHRLALGARSGEVVLHLAADSLYHSTEWVPHGSTAGTVSVPMAALDAVWRERGAPPVSVLKVDVEGAEPGVLRGARELLNTCRPAILVEAVSSARLDELVRVLGPLGYAHTRRPGFSPVNYLFLHEDDAPSGRRRVDSYPG
jgi:FkbM family methyltransferase